MENFKKTSTSQEYISKKRHTLAINEEGELYAWGWNRDAQLGDGTTVDKTSPVRIGTAKNWVDVAAGYSHSMAINADGELYAWGSGHFGHIGEAGGKNTPTRIGTASNWDKLVVSDEYVLAYNAEGEYYKG